MFKARNKESSFHSFVGLLVPVPFRVFNYILQQEYSVSMLVLFETAAGYALFKVLDKGILKDADDVASHFESPESAGKT